MRTTPARHVGLSRSSLAILIVLSTQAWIACAPAPPSQRAVISVAGVEAALQMFEEAWEHEDAQTAAGAFTADAVVFDPVPPGKFDKPEAIRAWIAGSFEHLDRIAIDILQVRVQIAGPVAWLTAHYVFEAQQEGNPFRAEGYMSMVWVLQTDRSLKASVFHASHLPTAGGG